MTISEKIVINLKKEGMKNEIHLSINNIKKKKKLYLLFLKEDLIILSIVF